MEMFINVLWSVCLGVLCVKTAVRVINWRRNLKKLRGMEKMMNVLQGCLFGLLGVASVVGVCLGNWYHIGTAAMCGAMVWVSVSEVRRLNK
jgi:hypothetical protein